MTETFTLPKLRLPWILAAITALLLAVVFLPGWVKTLLATKGAVATHTQLVFAANVQNLDAIRTLCTERYLSGHPLRVAKEGGVVGFPRNIDKNFQVWREGEIVLLCPSNRVGPVYRFVREDGRWKFDGPAGLLRAHGEFVRSAEGSDQPIDLGQMP